MTCPSCGGDNPDTASFCALCLSDFRGARPSQTLQTAEQARRQGEQPELEDLRVQIESPHPLPAPEISAPRMIAVVSASAVAGLLLALLIDLGPIPFAWLIAPLLAGTLAGRLLGDNGDRFGLAAASLVAASRVAIPFAAARTNQQAARAAVGNLASDVTTSAARLLQNTVAPSPTAQIPAITLAVVLAFAAGYFGGRYGERLARGPGHGV